VTHAARVVMEMTTVRSYRNASQGQRLPRSAAATLTGSRSDNFSVSIDPSRPSGNYRSAHPVRDTFATQRAPTSLPAAYKPRARHGYVLNRPSQPKYPRPVIAPVLTAAQQLARAELARRRFNEEVARANAQVIESVSSSSGSWQAAQLAPMVRPRERAVRIGEAKNPGPKRKDARILRDAKDIEKALGARTERKRAPPAPAAAASGRRRTNRGPANPPMAPPSRPRGTLESSGPNPTNRRKSRTDGQTATSTALDVIHKTDDIRALQAIAYMKTFAFIEHPSHGPGSSGANPVVFGAFTHSQAYDIQPFVASSPPWRNGGTVQPMMNPEGSIALLIMPHIAWDNNSGDLPPNGLTTITPGMWIDPSANAVTGNFTLNLNSAPTFTPYYKGGPLFAPPVPLRGFQSGFPTCQAPPNLTAAQTTALVLPNDDSDNPVGQCSVRFRTLGLRATVTVSQNFVDAQGALFAGDNCDFYRSAAGQDLLQNRVLPLSQFSASTALGGGTTGIIQVNQTTTELVALGNESLNECLNLRHVHQVGSYLSGTVVEANFLPVNNRILDWHERLVPLCNEAIATYDPQQLESTFDVLINQPALIFMLSGMDPNTPQSVAVDLTWLVELEVAPEGQLGWLLPDAAEMENFASKIDWSTNEQLHHGGRFGSVQPEFANTPTGSIGVQQCIGTIPSPGGRPVLELPQGARAAYVHGALGSAGTGHLGQENEGGFIGTIESLVTDVVEVFTMAEGLVGGLFSAIF